MDIEMLASRSGETVELKYIAFLVAPYVFPCLARAGISVLVAQYFSPCLMRVYIFVLVAH